MSGLLPNDRFGRLPFRFSEAFGGRKFVGKTEGILRILDSGILFYLPLYLIRSRDVCFWIIL